MDIDMNLLALVASDPAKAVATLLAELKTIDDGLVTSAGTIAERRKAAHEFVTTHVPLDKGAPNAPVAILTIADLERQIAALQSELDDAREVVKEAADGYLRTSKDASSAERDALKVAREAVVRKLTALSALGLATGEIPKAPKGSGGSSGGGSTRVATSKGTLAYRREGDAEWTVPCDAQQSLSATAYRVFGGAPSADLHSALNGTDLTKSWEKTVTLTGKDGKARTATIKFDVAPVTE